nr:hypothetical protein [Aeromicrobium sp. REDSEA-S32_B7]
MDDQAALLALDGRVEHLTGGERRRHGDDVVLEQLGQPHAAAVGPRVVGSHVRPHGELGQRRRAERTTGATGGDDEVGTAAHRVVDVERGRLDDGRRGVVVAQAGEERRDDVGERRGRRRDGDPVEAALGLHAGGGAQRLGRRQHVAGQRQEAASRGGQHEPSGHALEEVDAELALELAELAREGGLRDAHPLGGRAHGARVDDGDEGRQRPDLHGAILCTGCMDVIVDRHWTAWVGRVETGHAAATAARLDPSGRPREDPPCPCPRDVTSPPRSPDLGRRS